MLPKSRQAPCGPHLHGMHNPPSQDTRSDRACSAPAGLTAVASSVLGMNVTLSLLSLHIRGFGEPPICRAVIERRPMAVGVYSPSICNALNGWFRGVLLLGSNDGVAARS
ncbi:hypothetical protein PspLS_07278 [Pyricularia sp. CBS 133598]|nr:hypothetical protein PspLS_07278 [Pyricularia sp. CBS 133598]